MSAGVPKKELLYIGRETRSPSTEPHADGRPTHMKKLNTLFLRTHNI
jgi:hypothetical protein